MNITPENLAPARGLTQIAFTRCSSITAPTEDCFAIVEEPDGSYTLAMDNVDQRVGDFMDFSMVEVSEETLVELAECILAHVNSKAMPKTRTNKPKPQGYSALSPQAQKIYQHMQRAASISARDAYNDYGITSATLARRMCDIAEAGFTVVREKKVHPTTGNRYTRYSLAQNKG